MILDITCGTGVMHRGRQELLDRIFGYRVTVLAPMLRRCSVREAVEYFGPVQALIVSHVDQARGLNLRAPIPILLEQYLKEADGSKVTFPAPHQVMTKRGIESEFRTDLGHKTYQIVGYTDLHGIPIKSVPT